ncbi:MULTISPECIES: SPFH domain-containing protein [unclassified Bacillus cereus group]|uniref:SPFH domain-containing protein n=1 Tax=unclassified Bacillus cereus group TaxID=2750818 RepID=UPI001F561FF3|nr:MULTISPECIES: SPFH domain-containing protein [unclassified Bacillus cereus group]
MGMIIAGIIGLIVLGVVISSIKVVTTGQVYIVERFGKFHRELEPGWYFIVPFIDFVRAKVSTKQQIIDIPPQKVITKDNVSIHMDNVVFFRITDAKAAVYNIENYKDGIVYSTIANVRNIVGDMDLDDVSKNRDELNKELLNTVDKITDSYGVKILSVEINNIIPPAKIQEAMELQMQAERLRREGILKAEGEKEASILRAKGRKESQIAEAEGNKSARILNAEAQKEESIRLAEGKKEATLLNSQAQAESIEIVSEAEAKKIIRINEAITQSDNIEAVLKWKQIEANKEMAYGPANKLVIPTDMMNSVGAIATVAETVQLTKKAS